MATQLQDDEQQPGMGTGGSTVTTTGSAGSTSGTGSGGSTPASGSSSTMPNTQTDVENIQNLNQGFDTSGLTNYVTQNQGQTAKNAIANASNAFTNQLGGWNAFGQSDQDKLNSAIYGGGDFQTAYNSMNQSYGGPTAIDRSQYNPQVQNYSDAANMLSNQSGMNTLEGQINPGISQGERNFDWLVYGGNPNFQANRSNVQSDANATIGLGNQAATDAQNQVAQRRSDIAAFNQAAHGYVQSQRDALNNLLDQQVNQANAADQAAFQQYQQFMQGGPQTFTASQTTLPEGYYLPGAEHYDWSNEPDATGMIYARDAPTNTSPYSFSATVDPSQYAHWTAASAPATRQNMATADQRNQYNIMEQLLDQYDQMTAPLGGARQAASGNIDQAAFQAALSNAQQQAQAASQGNSDWARQAIASGQAQSWNQIMAPVYRGMYGDMGDYLLQSNPSGGIYNPATQKYEVATPQQLAALNAPQTPGYTDASGAWVPPQGMAFGGQVKKREPASPGSLKRGPEPNPLLQMGGRGGMPQIAAASPQNSGSVLNPVGQMGYVGGGTIRIRPDMAAGGHIPLGAGIPGKVDSVPIQADEGEYVVTKPSAKSLGRQNMDGLNNIAKQPPEKQQHVRNALHAALSRAIQ